MDTTHKMQLATLIIPSITAIICGLISAHAVIESARITSGLAPQAKQNPQPAISQVKRDHSRSLFIWADLIMFALPSSAALFVLAWVAFGGSFLVTLPQLGLLALSASAALFWLLSWVMVLGVRFLGRCHRLTWDGNTRTWQMTELVLKRLG